MKSLRKIRMPLFMGGLFGLGVASYTSFVPPYLSSLGFENSTISYMFALGPLAAVILSPIVGRISDSSGRKKIILLSVFLEIFVLLSFINIPKSVITVALIITLETIAIHLLQILALSQVEDKIKAKKRGVLTGVYESVRTVGIIIGPMVGAYLVSKYPVNYVFKFAIIIFTTMAFINLIIKEKHTSKHFRPHLNDFNFFNEIKSFLKNQKLKGVSIIGVAMNFAHRGSMIFLPLFIVQDLSSPLKYVGILFSIRSVVYLFQFAYGYLCDKDGCEKYIIIGTTIAAFSYILISLSQNFITLTLSVILYSLGSGIWNTSALSHLSGIGEKAKKEGEILGAYSAISSMGVFISFIMSGTFVHFFGIRSLFILYSFIIFIAILSSKRYLYSKRLWNVGTPIFEPEKN